MNQTQSVCISMNFYISSLCLKGCGGSQKHGWVRAVFSKALHMLLFKCANMSKYLRMVLSKET